MTVRSAVQHVFLARVGGTAPLLDITPGQASVGGVGLTSDRRTLSYRSDADPPGALRVARAADGKDSRLLFPTPPKECAKSISRPAWNPANPSELAAICQSADGRSGLYVLRSDGTVLKALDPGVQKFDDVAFTRDGQRLVFQGEQSNGWDGGAIFSIDIAGTTPAVRLTTTVLPGQDADPVVSPDGKTIAFRRRVKTAGGTSFDLWLMDADGKNPRALLSGPQNDQDPSWSPAGDKLAFKSNRSGADRVWIMDIRSGALSVLSNNVTGSQTTPVWTGR